MTDHADPVFMACGVPTDAPPGTWEALADLARAAIRMEEQRRAHLTPEQRATEDNHRAEGRARLDRIRRRAAADERP